MAKPESCGLTVANFVRSGANEQSNTQPKCSRSVLIFFPVAASQSAVVLSALVLATKAPLQWTERATGGVGVSDANRTN